MYDRTHRNPYFLNVINKYECKSRKVYDNLTHSEAIDLEIAQIAKRKSEGQAYCNLTDGGEGFPSGPENPTYLRDWSGENNPFYGKEHSEETKRKISENRKGKGGQPGILNPMYGKEGMVGEENPMYGKTGFKHHNHKKILAQYPDGTKEYLTSKQAEKKFGGSPFNRVRSTGGVLEYRKKCANKELYEGAIITIVKPVTTIEK